MLPVDFCKISPDVLSKEAIKTQIKKADDDDMMGWAYIFDKLVHT